MSKYVTTGTVGKHLHSRRNCPNLVGSDDINIREASEQEKQIRDECAVCHVEIVTCEYCGDTFHSNGLSCHQKYCDENPDALGSKLPVLD